MIPKKRSLEPKKKPPTRPARAAAAPRPEATVEPSFPIVGIGASAGGLEAYEQFFSTMPADSGLGFVLVPHLDPTHASMMTDLLRRVTALPVEEAQEGMRVEPNHIYIIPPNSDLAIRRGALKLETPLKSHGLRLPIDSFLRSLAQDQMERAICIILSGTGSDGSLGLRAVHGAGGMSIVQDPASARYGGMPASAIQTGLADLILPVDQMAAHLLNFVKQFIRLGAQPTLSQKREAALRRILSLVRSHTGHDFSLYKRSTLFRRLEKRMNLHQIEDAGAYVQYVQEHPDELQLLFKDMIIGVTSFFRDPEAFETLRAKVLPGFLAERPEGSTVRIWVPACGTGEEAYSLAMVFTECLDKLQRDINVQVFGTDIDEDAIAVARGGSYAANITADVNPERLRRFFFKEESALRIKKEIREMVVFAVQDLVKDPPFTKLDILSCRNLLIYLEPELQDRLLPVFYYSLKPGGILFLGTAETVGKRTDLFGVVDKKWKIYTAKPSAPGAREELYLGLPRIAPAPPEAAGEERPKSKALDIPDLAHRALLDAFAPASVIVDDKGDILYVHGQTGRYLEPAQGNASLNIMAMAREGIRHELRAAVHQALSKSKMSRFQGLKVRTNGNEAIVDLTVRPLNQDKETPRLVLVTFEETPRPGVEPGGGVKKKPKTSVDNRVLDLEQELAYNRESLQATVEELQASNEELKSTNEELQSTNEEFQSANEELETSREELQSMNEELVTLNSELQAKIDQLSQAENDMRILLDNTKIAIVFLDPKLRILRFTAEATKVFNLIPTDIGRPITDIRSRLEYGDLAADVTKVGETLQPLESVVQAADGTSYLMKIIPYRTTEGEVVGLVLVFADVTLIKEASPAGLPARVSRQTQDYAQNLVGTMRQPLVVLDEDLRVVSANHAFYEILSVTPEEIERRTLFEIGKPEWDIPALKKLMISVLPQGKEVVDFEIEQDVPGIGPKRLVLNARKIAYQEVVARPLILLGVEEAPSPGTKRMD